MPVLTQEGMDDVVLDLHEDITLDPVSEWYKDIAGVPSTFTNITDHRTLLVVP